MNTIINKIDNLQKQLQGLSPLKAEDQFRLNKKFRLEFSYNSNHLEGNTLSYGETELLLIFDKTTGNHDMREYEEMKAHDVVFELIQQWAKDTERPLSEAGIKNLHAHLLVQPFWKDAITSDGQPTRRLIKIGDYKELPNSVRLQNGALFHYASPQDTPMLMGELIEWYKEEEIKRNLQPVVLAAMLHYKFVRIHPFDDGNGRISRLLMNYVLLRHNLPPVIIKSSNKKDYLFALNQADTGDIDSFIQYIAEQLVWSLDISIKAAKGENIDEPGDLEKKLFSLKKKIGQAGDEKVNVKLDKTIFYDVIDNCIKPLAEEWEKGLQKFDSLFFSRKNTVYLNEFHYSGSNLLNTLFDYLAKFSKAGFPDNFLFKKVTLSCDFIKLITSKDHGSFNGGRIDINFHENIYEITYSGSSKTIRKFYHQYLNDKEQEDIISTIGNWALKHIEKAIENGNN